MPRRDPPPSADTVDGAEIDEETKKKREEQAKKDQAMAKSVMAAAAGLVRASNGLPRSGDNYEILRSYGSFATLMQQQERRVTSLLSKVLSSAGSRTRLPRVERAADFEHLFDRVVEANDGIVERAGIVLDELERARRDATVKVPRAVIDAESTKRSLASDDIGSNAHHHQLLLEGAEGFKIPLKEGGELTRQQRDRAALARISTSTLKPQKAFGFADTIDNSSAQFMPLLKQKHHEMEKKRAEGLVVRDEEGTEKSSTWQSDEAVAVHPYTYELDHFEVPQRQLESTPPKKYADMASTPLTLVDTKEELLKLIEKLNASKEFAVDLEAHSHRTFAGLTCLIQISTRDDDFIVDPFPIWKDMHLLNEPFSDPNILKVFHGADSDVLWLQRDFNIFVRNVFDTYRAMKRDGSFTKFSLAALVSVYCGVQLQKEYQLADWRIRPLPADHIEYARGDTHYLLYCQDRLRESLLESGNEHANLLRAVYTDGVELSRKLYVKPEFDVDGYRSLIGTRKSFNNRQLYALAALWRWRDATAREEDESTAYVLPNHMMIHIAEALPREMQGILACCSPVPLLVKQHLLPLHRIIYAARDRPLEKTVTLSSRTDGEHGADRGLFESMIDEANRMTHMKSLLRSQLDFSHCAFNEEIGSLLRKKEDNDEDDVSSIVEKTDEETYLSVMGLVRVQREEEKRKSAESAADKDVLEEWATPYERYNLAVTENEKKHEAARIAAELRRKERGNVDEQGRKLYSHHDPTVCRKPVFKEENENGDSGLIDINGGDEESRKRKAHTGQWTDEDVLTKKKMKQLQKKRKANADMSIEGPSAKKSTTPKKEVKEETQEDGDVVVEERGDEEEGEDSKTFDYTKYDAKAMFEQSQAAANATSYNPLRDVDLSRRGKQRGKARSNRGGHTRARGMSHSFSTRGRN